MWTRETIRENPMLSTLIAFGAGLGVGVVLAGMLSEPAHVSRRRSAEAFGRRMLDALTEALPDSVRRRVQA